MVNCETCYKYILKNDDYFICPNCSHPVHDDCDDEAFGGLCVICAEKNGLDLGKLNASRKLK